MTRTTQSQLEGTAHRLNAMLEERGSTARVDVSGRIGHQGLDVYTTDRGPTAPTKTLTVGTKTEIWDYMHAMISALYLLEEPYRD